MLIITTVKKQKKQDERLQQIAQGYKEQNNELLRRLALSMNIYQKLFLINS